MDERDYRGGPDEGDPSAMKAVFILIAINVLMYLSVRPSDPVYYELALSAQGVREFKLWELATYAFLHGGFTHIFFNMWGLYLFGGIVARVMGAARFLNLYFISMLTGSVLWLLFNWNSPYPAIGASGALFGVMMAVAMLRPDAQFFLLIPPMPIKTKTLVIVYAVLEVLMELSNMQTGIAHLVHLGGFVGAYAYLRIACPGMVEWDPLGFLKKDGGAGRAKKARAAGWSYAKPSPGPMSQDGFDKPVSKVDIDRVLDKISVSGINSLTEEETNLLRRAREQMKNKR